MSDWIQAGIALLFLGGAIGGFLAQIIHRKLQVQVTPPATRNGSGTGVIEAVLSDYRKQRGEQWDRFDRDMREAVSRTHNCEERLDALEEVCRNLSARLEECMSRQEGERRADVS